MPGLFALHRDCPPLPPWLPPPPRRRLQHNRLSGTLPGSWAASLPSLQILSIHENQLRGTMPVEWYKPGTFQKLEEMYIQSNQVREDASEGVQVARPAAVAAAAAAVECRQGSC